jgi:release factor glutamine methyltransferase
MNIRKLLEQATQELSAFYPESARTDAEILLCHALEVQRSFIYANPELMAPAQCRQDFLRLVRERSQGTPVAYLTGKRSFWSLELMVNANVLIPRPETELLVETALSLIPADIVQRVADLGTGSGAVALALARERALWEVHATDLSGKALEVARENARRNGVAHVRFHEGCWTEPLQGKFDLIVSNPPYVAEDDPHLLRGDCRFEPRMALTPGADGLGALRQIATASRTLLNHGAWLLLEHGYDQGPAVRSLLHAAGYEDVRTLHDLAGLERVCCGRFRNQKTGNPAGPLVYSACVF